MNIQQLIKKELNPYLRGRGNYFGIGDVKKRFQGWDRWIRRRLRAVQLRSWDNELPDLRMTAWRSSHSTYSQYAMPNSWFEEMKLCSLAELYNNLHPHRGQLSEEPYAMTRTYGEAHVIDMGLLYFST